MNPKVFDIYNKLIDRLKQELPEDLYYHGPHHTIDVVGAVKNYCFEEQIEKDHEDILIIAAAYHDAGFLTKYHQNEHEGAKIARQDLLKDHINDDVIKQVEQLILSTSMSHHPENLFEQILSDADFDYFGRDDFHEISETLRQELNLHDHNFSKKEWDEVQVDFLEKHQYYTNTAKKLRLPKKLSNLNEIKERLKSY